MMLDLPNVRALCAALGIAWLSAAIDVAAPTNDVEALDTSRTDRSEGGP